MNQALFYRLIATIWCILGVVGFSIGDHSTTPFVMIALGQLFFIHADIKDATKKAAQHNEHKQKQM